MQRRFLMFGIQLFTVLLLCSSAHAGWRFPVGFTYVNGFDDVVDIFKENIEYEGYLVEDASSVPVGLSAHPYYQFESGFGVGGSVGPLMMIFGDPFFLTIVPVGLDARYIFAPSGPVSPYVRAGVRYPIVGGDFVGDASPGLFGGIGVEFLKDHPKVNMGIEISYDASEIEMARLQTATIEKIQPVGLMVSVFAVFF